MKTPLCLSSLSSGLVWVDLLSVLVESNSWWWRTVAATFTGTDTVERIVSHSMPWKKGCSTKVHLSSARRTGQSCHEWRMRHSTAAWGTSWERCILGIQMRPRYHLRSKVSVVFQKACMPCYSIASNHQHLAYSFAFSNQPPHRS